MGIIEEKKPIKRIQFSRQFSLSFRVKNYVNLIKNKNKKLIKFHKRNEKEGIPVDIINLLDICVEIPQLGVIRSLNVHVSAAIAIWEYSKQNLNLNAVK